MCSLITAIKRNVMFIKKTNKQTSVVIFTTVIKKKNKRNRKKRNKICSERAAAKSALNEKPVLSCHPESARWERETGRFASV